MRAWMGMWVAIAWTLCGVAEAGNDDEILVGNDAALSAGAVTAVIEDGSSLYYNPAGMVAIQDDTIDVSGSAYTLRRYSIGGLLRLSDGTSTGDSFSEVVIVPSAVAFVRPLSSGVRIGVGVFTTKQQDLKLRTQLVSQLDDGREQRILLTYVDQIQILYGTVGVAWAATDRLRLGATLSLSYGSVDRSVQFGVGANEPTDMAEASFSASSNLFAIQAVGLRLGFGAQLRLTDSWRVGLALQTPGGFFYASSQVDELSSFVSPQTPATFDTSQDDQGGFGWEWYEPMRVRAGVSYHAGERYWVSVDVDVHSPIVNPDTDQDRVTQVNARLGGLVRLHTGWWLGAGLFTDRSGNNPDRGVPDFYGGTVGFRYRAERKLDKEVEDEDRLTFESVFAVRYAYGVGQVAALLVFPDGSTSEPSTDLAVHEVSLHVGAGLRF